MGVVFGCVCMCCLRCVVGCRRCVGGQEMLGIQHLGVSGWFGQTTDKRFEVEVPSTAPETLRVGVSGVWTWLDMVAFSGYTRRRLERTHGGVLNLHTEGFSAFSVFLALCLSFLLSLFLSFSALFLRSLSLLSSLLFSSLLFSSLFSSLLFSLLFSLSNDDNDRSSSRFSLCTHGSDL